MSDETGDFSEREQRLNEVILAYVKALDAGQPIDRQEWLDRYPDLAPELLAFFAGLDQVDSLIGPVPETLSPTQPFRRKTIPSFGPFEDLTWIGEGGMGVVYQAWQKSPHKLVALKMIRTGTLASPAEVQRFRDEADKVAELDHPHIVPVHEAGEYDGLHYFTMKLMKGGSLEKHLSRFARDPKAAAGLLVAVARAVHYAHQRGILHRDLKPGNILLEWPAGEAGPPVPHVTDFGLAKRIEGDGSLTQSGAIVGTPSYMAPEQAQSRKGVSTAADVYSLGAILYELLTGRPPFKAESPLETLQLVIEREPVRPRVHNPKVNRDLETICLKCLEKDPRRRYGSAEALAEDLERWLAYKPIKARPASRTERFWRLCRRNPALASLTALVAILLVVLAVGSSVAALWLREQREDLLQSLKRAMQAEKEKTKELWGAYLAQARAGHWSGRPGRRFDSLAALAKAAAIRPSLELRNEAIACMALADIRVAKTCRGWPAGTMAATFDPGFRRYASSDRAGNISVRRVADDREVARLSGPGSHAWNLGFSPNGRFLAAIYHLNSELRIWNVRRRKPLLRFKAIGGWFDFSPDGHWLAVSQPEGSRWISLYDLVSGKEAKRLTKLPKSGQVKFHPDGRILAVAVDRPPSGMDVLLYDWNTEKVHFPLTHPGVVRGLAWHPEGKLLAVSCGLHIHVWDTVTGRLLKILEGHHAEPTALAFSHAGGLLVSTGWDDTLRLWDPLAGKELLWKANARFTLTPQFSSDDRLLAGTTNGPDIEIWEVADGRECRALYSYAERAKGPVHVDLSPDGRLLASGHSDGVRLWDVPAARQVAHLPVGFRSKGLFHPGGEEIITLGPFGLTRWPMRREPDRPSAGMHIGPPRCLLTLSPSDMGHSLSSSPDGRWLAVSNSRQNQAIVLDLRNPTRKKVLPGHPHINEVAISPDGHWLASSTFFQFPREQMPILNVRRATRVRNLPDQRCPRFSPDGQWLATCRDECRLWKVGTWRLGQVIHGPGSSGPVAFSRDSKLLAIAYASRVIQLVEMATGRKLATLAAPDPRQVVWLCFNAEGTHLAAASSEHVIQVWDLRLIRQRLAEMNLDWHLPPYPPTKSRRMPKPLRVDLDLGDLKRIR
jgi:WD40 repeat protein